MAFKLICECGKTANIVTNIINSSEIELGVMCKACNIYSCLNYIRLSPEMKNIKTKEIKTEEQNIYTDKDLQTYLDYMYKNVKEGNAPGYIRIGRETGIGVKKAEKIKAHLEMKGIVKVINNRTKIMKEVV